MPTVISWAQNNYLKWIAQEDSERQAQVQVYRDYYDGSHFVPMTDRQATYLNLDGKMRGVNLCAVVIDTPCERLHLSGFTVSAKQQAGQPEPKARDLATPESDTPDSTQQLAALLDGWWAGSRMDAVQGWVHSAAFRDAEAFVIVDYDEDESRPCISHDFAYDGTSGVKIHIKPGTYNRVVCASKRWQEKVDSTRTVRRMNLYFPDRIEKWQSTAPTQGVVNEARWEPLDIAATNDPTLVSVELKDGDGNSYTTTVAWWTEDGTQTGKPLGVPVIPFINKDDGTGKGISELEAAIPCQDAYNKNWLDTLAAADMTGFGMYVQNGIGPDNGYEIYPGAMLPIVPRKDGETASITALPSGDLSQLISNGQNIISVMAGVTATPQSRFTPAAVRPAEGTQQQEEGPLLAKVQDRQRVWGNAWEDVMQMALKVARAFGGAAIPDANGLVIDATWKEAETRNETDHMNALAVKAEKLGVPLEQLWSEAGYSAAEIRKFKADAAKKQAAARLADARAKAQQAAQQAVGGQPPPQNNNGQQPASGQPSGGSGNGVGENKTPQPMMEMSRF